MGTAEGMIAAARKSVGLAGRPNYITNDYASRHGAEFRSAAWCDMGVTYWARQSGNADAVLPAGDRAYTVSHASDFQKRGRWFAGTKANVNKARPGDIVFFDWGGSDGIGAIDHVGVVVKALGGGKVETIEANTSNSVRVRTRDYSVIAGYGRPAYSGGDAPAKPSKPSKSKAPAFAGRILSQPPLMYGADVRAWQAQMRKRGWSITVDGWYGAESERACRAFQAEKRLAVDGQVGPVTWSATWDAPVT